MKRNQRLRIATPCYPLSEFVAEVGKVASSRGALVVSRSMPGIRISVFARQADWQGILRDIATLVNGVWVNERGIPVSQFEDPANRISLTHPANIRKYEERLLRDFLRQGAVPLFQFAALSRIPIERWKSSSAINETNPLLHSGNRRSLAHKESHARLQLLDSLAPSQKEELMRSQVVTLLWGTMSSAQREAALIALKPSLFDEMDHPLPESVVERHKAQSLDFLAGYGMRLRITRNSVTGLVEQFNSSASFNEKMRSANERSVLPPTTRGIPYTVRATSDTDKEPSYLDLERQPFPRFPLSIAANKSPEALWAQILTSLSEAVPQYTLLSDAYTGTPAQVLGIFGPGRHPYPIDTEQLMRRNFAEGLDYLCEQFGRVWWRRGDTLFFRSKSWFLRQLYEVPAPTIKRLAQILRKPPLDCLQLLAELAQFSREQLEGLSVAAYYENQRSPSPGNLRSPYYFNTATIYEYLQLTALLNRSQQAQALSALGGDGLLLADMNEPQRAALLRLLTEMHGARVFDQFDQIRFQIIGGGGKPKAEKPQPSAAPQQSGIPERLSCQFLFGALHPGPFRPYSLAVTFLTPTANVTLAS